MKKNLILALILFSSSILFGQCLSTEKEFEEYYKKNIQTLDMIEGIWSVNYTIKVYDQNNRLVQNEYEPQVSKCAIIKNSSNFRICKLNESNETSISTFSPTATRGVYLYQKTFSETNFIAKATAIINSGSLLEFSYEFPEKELKRMFGSDIVKGTSVIGEFKLIKLLPTLDEQQEALPASGTGFAISSNGIIATNFHVINGAKIIKVRGINGDFNKAFIAKVLFSDKNNDLALIQIDEIGFSTLGTIPYVIKTKLSNVGESIFVLGYPLRASMGDEIKLTNGIISSKTGFQGDVTSYQISAPIQPGNSGGPIFDSQGNLIGIINAKHSGAENASYAVKSSYLISLFELFSSPPKLQSISQLNEKNLSSQVDIIKNFVYIIEIN